MRARALVCVWPTERSDGRPKHCKAVPKCGQCIVVARGNSQNEGDKSMSQPIEIGHQRRLWNRSSEDSEPSDDLACGLSTRSGRSLCTTACSGMKNPQEVLVASHPHTITRARKGRKASACGDLVKKRVTLRQQIWSESGMRKCYTATGSTVPQHERSIRTCRFCQLVT